MGVAGYCSRCGYCCKIGISMGFMKDSLDDYCRYMYWENGLATCPFREGETEPKQAYEYWLKCCVPFPRNQSDIISVKPHCTYFWEADS